MTGLEQAGVNMLETIHQIRLASGYGVVKPIDGLVGYIENQKAKLARALSAEEKANANVADLLDEMAEFVGIMDDCGSWPDTSDERAKLSAAAERCRELICKIRGVTHG